MSRSREKTRLRFYFGFLAQLTAFGVTPALASTKLVPFSSAALEKSKHQSSFSRLLEEVRLECSSFAACQAKKMTDPKSGAACFVNRDIQNLDFLCEVGRVGSIARARYKLEQLNCLLPQAQDQRYSRSRACNYDLEVMADHIQALAEIPCVKQILVPDRYLTDETLPLQSENYRKKVIFGEVFPGSFTLHLKQECAAEGK